MSSDFYTTIASGIRCNLCFRHCSLAEGEIGYCKVNTNSLGKLKSLTRGFPTAVNIDPIEKKPLYHFAPGSSVYSIGTVGCNFHCPFCQNWSLAFGKLSPKTAPVKNEDIIKNILESGCKIVAFTYNEPTTSWLWFREIAKLAKEAGLLTVVVSNGAMGNVVADDMCDLIDAVNIDLKCGSSDIYKTVLKGNRGIVLKNLKKFQAAKVWVEITTLLVPGISDTAEDLKKSAIEIEKLLGLAVPWHISAYYPAHQYKKPSTPSKTVIDSCNSLLKAGFKYVYSGNINSRSNTLCTNCGELVISRNGYDTVSYLESGRCGNCREKLDGRFYD